MGIKNIIFKNRLRVNSGKKSFSLQLLLTVFLVTGMLLISCDDDPTGIDDPDPEPEVEAVFTFEPEFPNAGDEVTLDASGSTVTNGADPEYSWTLNTPAGSEAELESETGEVTGFTADGPGEYNVDLVVTANGVSDGAAGQIEVTAQEEISSDITEDRTLSSEISYTVANEIDIEATLTVEPGTVIEFENGTGFEIREAGALNAEGTEDEQIIFTGTDGQPGWWNGLFFRDSENLNNVLDYAIVEYAGGEEFTGSGEANIVVGRSLGGDASVTITNTTLRNSGSYGMYVHSNGELSEFVMNTFSDNDEAPVNIGSDKAHVLDAESTYSGNENEFIEVRSGYDIDEENVEWNNLDVPYRITSGEIEIENVNFTISEGTTIEFENNASLEFLSGGGLIADGTENDPILFTGSDEQPGWWNGIYIRSSTNTNNILNHVTVEYGGGDEFTRSGAGNVVVASSLGGDASIDITNTTLRYSGSDGLWVRNNGELPEFSNNTITENEGTPVNISSYNAHQLDDESDYTGNADDYIYVRGDSDIDSENVTWESLEVDYRVSSDHIEINGINMTINPGVTLEFENGGGFEFRDDAGLIAEGTETDPIIFTGTEEQQGWWDGIFLRNTTNTVNRLDFVTIEYGGGDDFTGTDAANLVVGRSLDGESHAEVTNSIFSHSASHGIYVHQNGSLNEDVCDVNSFADNSDEDCLFDN